GKQLNVRAIDVVGSIQLVGSPLHSENDFYAFQGKAGDVVNVEVLSATLKTRISNAIDSVVRVFRSDGTLVPYYGGPAVNDDGFENQDSILTDLVLPADGTYFIEVDTFSGIRLPGTAVGDYQLLVCRSATASNRLVGGGD